MPISDENVRLQTIVSKETAEKIKRFAKRGEMSDSQMIALLLEACVSQSDWMIRLVTSRYVKKVAKMFGGKSASTDAGEPQGSV